MVDQFDKFMKELENSSKIQTDKKELLERISKLSDSIEDDYPDIAIILNTLINASCTKRMPQLVKFCGTLNATIDSCLDDLGYTGHKETR